MLDKHVRDENGLDAIGDVDASDAYVMQLARSSFRSHTKRGYFYHSYN